MTDKQQIEEMVKLMAKNWFNETMLSTAERLYNANYRRVPENAVVLTREEFGRLNSCIKSEEEVRAIMQQQMLPMVRELTDKEVGKKLATVTALARKKTAKEIFTKLIEVAKNNDNKLSIGLLKAWAIEYDVEVE